MARFLIEVPHDGERVACARVVQVFQQTGSHYLTHADWGCRDGDHRSWMIVDAATKEEARNIVPPPYRATAKVIGLNFFSVEEIEDILKTHKA